MATLRRQAPSVSAKDNVSAKAAGASADYDLVETATESAYADLDGSQGLYHNPAFIPAPCHHVVLHGSSGQTATEEHTEKEVPPRQLKQLVVTNGGGPRRLWVLAWTSSILTLVAIGLAVAGIRAGNNNTNNNDNATLAALEAEMSRLQAG